MAPRPRVRPFGRQPRCATASPTVRRVTVRSGPAWGVAAAAAVLTFVTPAAAQGAVPCPKSWTRQYSPALAVHDLPKRLAIGRKVKFRFDQAAGPKVATYRSDVPAAVAIRQGARDLSPYSRVFSGDLRKRGIPIKPKRLRGGRIATVRVSWAEDRGGPDGQTASQPCRRTASYRVRVIEGYAPRIMTNASNGRVSFKVLQRRGKHCAKTQPGAIRLSVRGPDRQRVLRLSDTCGKWSKRRHGRGWQLFGRENYDRTLGSDEETPAEALLDFGYETPGTRTFRYRVTWRGRTLKSAVLSLRVRVCRLRVCRS